MRANTIRKPTRSENRSVEDVMPILDSQVHAYERNHPGRPWVGTLTGPEEVTGDQMVAAMDEAGVDLDPGLALQHVPL